MKWKNEESWNENGKEKSLREHLINWDWDWEK